MSVAPGSDPAEDGGGTTPTVFLHIGTYKSGTSFIQSVLARNRELLEAAGVFYPVGSRTGAQIRAVRDVLGIRGPAPDDGAWEEIVTQIKNSSARCALVSMEFLSLATPEQAARIVADLQPCRVEVILTVRDLLRVLPSAWQSMVKQGHPWAFEEFTDSVIGTGEADPEPGRRFWQHHDLERLVGSWAPAVGSQNIHLVTVPRSGAPPELLWERYASVIGVVPESYDTEMDKESNFSLSYSDTELMRRLNLVLRPQLDRVAFKRWGTRFFANEVLREPSAAAAADDRVRVPRDTHDWAIQRSAQDVERLEQLDLHVVGDLSDLVPAPHDETSEAGRTEPSYIYPDNVIEMLSIVLKRLAKLEPGSAPRRSKKGRRLQVQRRDAGPRRDEEESDVVHEGSYE